MNKKVIFSLLLVFSIALISISLVSSGCPSGEYCSVITFMKFTDDLSASSKTVDLGDKVDLELIAIGYGSPLTYEKLVSGSTTIVERNFPGLYSGSTYTSSETFELDTTTLGIGTHILEFTASDGSFVSYPSTLILIIEPIIIPDTNPPVITVLGNNPETIEVLTIYTDAGATAYDIEDGDLTLNINITNPVNTNLVGNYTIIYYVEDTAGNSDQETRTVQVINSTIPPTPDTNPPVITVLGNNPETIEVLSTYTDAGATAWDTEDGNLTSQIQITNFVNTNLVGNYTVTYSVQDSANNSAQETRTVQVINSTIPPTPDTTDPSIEIEYPTNGATYLDHRTYLRFNVSDENLDYCTYKLNSNPTQIDSCSNGINYIFSISSVEGSNTWTVTAYDKFGNNASDSITFYVNIVPPVDNDPVITALGNNPETVEVLTSYIDAGATAHDAEDGDISSDIVTSGLVNTNLVGNYTITYYVQDSANNSDTETRTVRVINSTIPPTPDTTDPILIITYPRDGATYTSNITELNFTVNDTNLQACWYQLDSNPTQMYSCSNGPNTITGIASIEGSNTWKVFANDTSGNEADDVVTFIVSTPIVPDTNPPTINITGNNPETVEVLSIYDDAGATAWDAEDGNLTNKILKLGLVNTNLVGNYTLTYSVQDSANNSAQATRIVQVINSTIPPTPDTTAPIITIIIPQNNQVLQEGETIIFNITVNENALTVYSLDGNINVSMNEVAYLNFISGSLTPAIGNHQVIFCATDTSSNTACETENFIVEKKKEEKKEKKKGSSSVKEFFYNDTATGFNKTIITESLLFDQKEIPKQEINWNKILFWILILVILLTIYLIYFSSKKENN